jgi:hypothetical protein
MEPNVFHISVKEISSSTDSPAHVPSEPIFPTVHVFNANKIVAGVMPMDVLNVKMDS